MSYVGDIRLGSTLDVKFCTVTTTGAPTTLAGSPVISAYPDNSVTQLTAGITLSVDFDSVTGLHNVRVVASGGNGYAIATNYSLVITTGTVSGTSVVGYVIGEFSIENRIGKGVWDEPTSGHTTAGTYGDKLGAHIKGILKAVIGTGSTTTAVKLDASTGVDGAAPSATNSFYNGRVIVFTSGTLAGQVGAITAYTGSTTTATVTTLTSAPANGDIGVIV